MSSNSNQRSGTLFFEHMATMITKIEALIMAYEEDALKNKPKRAASQPLAPPLQRRRADVQGQRPCRAPQRRWA
jgi:hypothetical protein